jgi:arsenate reductase
MAAGFLRHFAADHVRVLSAGSNPGTSINPIAAQAMAEVGIDIAHQTPQQFDVESVQQADVVITMGCGDTCPVFPGKRYEDWALEDPAGQPIEIVRQIRDDIEHRVKELYRSLVNA